MPNELNNLLNVRDLKKYFPIRSGLLARAVGYVHAVDGVSFTLKAGETLGLVGESGCGKTTLGRCLIRLYEPTDGVIEFCGKNIVSLEQSELIEVRTQMQMIFQDPYSSLNPRMRVRDIIGEALRVHHLVPVDQQEERVRELLCLVGLSADHMARYPHEFSGGQRQRIGVARALSMSPRLIVADEPVSALDVSVQAQVLNLLDSLKEKFNLSYLVIAHDLSVVEHISDRVAVMYLGRIVEEASAEELYLNPKHPYTVALLDAIPMAKPGGRARWKNRRLLKGDICSPINLPPGCRFHSRCDRAKAVCRKEQPPWIEVSPRHFACCHLFT
jgi:oligopeptide transport system ATP-binding protein